ncbi:alpha-amylase family protein [Brachybacterium sp. EF45031]|uniref:alpha-amylase family protein n=1 Tax=Brachybacterium sillae TaxID=2810536 RepID=UPI00217E9ED8|nr:alpha-amylase family protein [Brachybacterium sillae]MCS6711143.1 alpha-amylase family protein [Brachybacterium sillae]
MLISQTADLWWKSAVVYCLDIETFFDADDDGVGDISGLVQRIDYLAELGVTCLWLMPFSPSGGRDDGYDITDHLAVDPRLGDVGDMVDLVRTAKSRGMRVIMDLVVNHTSDKHPWFRQARRSPDNRFRDYYVWADEPPGDTSDLVVFPDAEDSVWQYDEKAGQYYLHNFYREQPDLNVANPAVQAEIAKIIGFWMQMGMDGFRVDAVPFFLDDRGLTPQWRERFSDPHGYLRDLSFLVRRRQGDAILLGEVNLDYEEQVDYFGGEDGDELTMMFDFELMQRTHLAFARQDATPIAETLRRRPALSRRSQFATFLRNHDELTLDKLTDSERQEVFDAFGPEEDMQLFGRGLRRRLPPMLEGDPRRLRMAYSLLFSLPGTPVLFYGEEIGMGENLERPGRMAVRTPMQWTAGKNGGFSVVPPSRLVAPLTTGAYGPEHVNAEDQRRDPDSLLAFLTALAHRYRECPEVGMGSTAVLETDRPAVLAHCCTWTPYGGGSSRSLLVHNLSHEATTVEMHLPQQTEGTELLDLFSHERHEVGRDGLVRLELDAYGHHWLRLLTPDDRRLR